MTIAVPAAFAAHTVAREGQPGRRWIQGLPRRVAELCDRWGLAIDGAPLHGGLGLAVPVRANDALYVLKVAWPGPQVAEEILALRAWDGQGAVRLLRAEPAQGALLLERLDASRSLARVPLGEAIAVAGGLLAQLAIAAPPGVRTAAAYADELARTLPGRWAAQGRPFDAPLLERVVRAAEALRETTGTRLIHHDLDYTDVLASDRARWLAIDPKVAAGVPEFGMAQLLWRRLEEIEAQGGVSHHLGRLVEASGGDFALARAWVLVRAADYWLWGLGAGLTEDPERCRRLVAWADG